MTERTEHTPSPWRLDDKEPGELWVSNAERSYPVCMVTASGNVTARDKADARLIAAAPDLLAALRGLVEVNENHNESIARIIGKPLNWKDDYLDTARAAISKATGEA